MRTSSHPSLLRRSSRLSALGATAALLFSVAASAQTATDDAAASATPVPQPQVARALLVAEDQPLALSAATPVLVPSAPLSGESSSALPEAPSAVAAAEADATEGGAMGAGDRSRAGTKYPKTAAATDITVLPGQVAPRQTVRDKLVGSVRDSISPFSFVGEAISAGYSQLTNGSPNYGDDAGAFGQRFGAAVARGTTQNLFYEGATASIFHEDPRYYIMGNGKPFLKRVVYAATRPIITRTDGGRTTPNFALLTGYLGAAALTKVYYPPLNQGFDQTLQTYGGSIGGAALGYLASEFLSDALQIVHLKKAD